MGTRGPTRLAALLAAALLLGAGQPALAEEETPTENFFVGLGAGLCTLVYTPLKVAYAVTSLPLGGLVYLWSVGDAEMAGYVIKRGATGDYVVTPSHLRRERTLRFAGAHPEERRSRSAPEARDDDYEYDEESPW